MGIPTVIAFLCLFTSSALCFSKKACGITPLINKNSNERYGRIIGGQRAQKGEFPWQVSLQRVYNTDDDSESIHKCGATLLSPHWVITTAHCAYGVPQVEMLLKIGFINNSYPSQSYTVEKIIVHPHYNSLTFENDIALLKMKKKAKISSTVLPVCLSKGINIEDQVVTLTGWGRASQMGSSTESLMRVEAPVVPRKKCERWYEEVNQPQQIESTLICIGKKKGGKDACEGDSGGPVQLKANGRWYLVGIITFGIGGTCGKAKMPGVSVEMTNYIEWILDNTNHEVSVRSLTKNKKL